MTKSLMTAAAFFLPLGPLMAQEKEFLVAQEQLTLSAGPTTAVRFSPDGKQLFTLSDMTLKIWILPASGVPRAPAWSIDDVSAAAFSPDGKLLAVGRVKSTSKISIIVAFPVPTGKDYSSRLQLWDLSTRREAVLLEDWQKGMICALDFSADGKSLASSHYFNDQVLHLLGPIPIPLNNNSDAYAKVWDLAQRKERNRFPKLSGMSGSLAFSPDGASLMASCRWSHIVPLWDATSAQLQDALVSAPARADGFRQGVAALAFSPDGQTAALACNAWDPDANKKKLAGAPQAEKSTNEGVVLLWDLAKKERKETLSGHTDFVTSVAFAPDGKTLASASQDGTVRFWDPAAGRSFLTLYGHPAAVTALAFSADGKQLATASMDKTVKVWSLRKGSAAETAKIQEQEDRKKMQIEAQRQAERKAAAARREQSAANYLRRAKDCELKKDPSGARFYAGIVLKDYAETEAAKDTKTFWDANKEAWAADYLRKARDDWQKGDAKSLRKARYSCESVTKDFSDTRSAGEAKELLEKVKEKLKTVK